MVSVPKLILTAWMTESAGRQLLLLGATGLVGAQVLTDQVPIQAQLAQCVGNAIHRHLQTTRVMA